MRKVFLVLIGCLTLVMCSGSDDSVEKRFEPNYDESKVPRYTLPDPLVCLDGTGVTDLSTWEEKRRPEILELFQDQVYGRTPDDAVEASYSTVESGDALGGLAIRKQVEITLRRAGREVKVGVLIYLPETAEGPVPAFLGLNFAGNHTVSDDPAIILNTNWMRPNERAGIVDNRATEASRGTASSRWATEDIVKGGYALVTAYYGDIDPDFDDGFENGVHPLFDMPGRDSRPGDAWGSIGAWAWGLSRILDYLETDPAVDAGRVVVMGHSRLGKTSLWAGAQDRRFAMVISNNSGCGGAALSMRAFGETVGSINRYFTHWFCDNFSRYNENEAALPVDQHMLLALAAPRPVYVASAEEDQWADPRGEFLALKNAAPVYRLLTGDTFVDEMPAVNEPVIGRMGYHVRSGVHAVTEFDWEQYIRWADMFLKK